MACGGAAFPRRASVPRRRRFQFPKLPKPRITASMCLYQFLIAVRSEGQNLTNEDGETTSHLMGFFYRTLRMMDNGIKPIYVFDGKPPQMKSGELAKRGARRAAAEVSLKEAQEAGEQENIDKYTRRLVRVTKEHNTEVQQLLTLMGIPFVVAPAEAEAQCAALAAAGKVYGAASEDMDTLTFGTPTLLRHMTYSENRKKPINEVSYEQVLEGLEMTKETFVDLCILLGCDYCESIRGIGPHRALALLREHQSIENILASLDPDKFTVPEDWPYAEARRLF
ncbi:PIN domain-like protein, partial [Caulochytrium protostelioides]